jgi:NIMA (never in mitosis gene a)-related kinase
MSLKDFIILSKLGILFGSYHILGSGSFSEVFKVKRITDNKIYALKKVQLSSLGEREKENSLNEVRILASIQYGFSYKNAL